MVMPILTYIAYYIGGVIEVLQRGKIPDRG